MKLNIIRITVLKLFTICEIKLFIFSKILDYISWIVSIVIFAKISLNLEKLSIILFFTNSIFLKIPSIELVKFYDSSLIKLK